MGWIDGWKEGLMDGMDGELCGCDRIEYAECILKQIMIIPHNIIVFQTREHQLTVSPKSNAWSEYRVLAVKEKGTSQYSTPSSAIYIPPEKPTTPRNFRVNMMAALKGKVRVELVWSKPERSGELAIIYSIMMRYLMIILIFSPFHIKICILYVDFDLHYHGLSGEQHFVFKTL